MMRHPDPFLYWLPVDFPKTESSDEGIFRANKLFWQNVARVSDIGG